MHARIIEVAGTLFARRGIDGVSIAEVALAAGVSKANVMHHFGSKDRLYAACLDVIDAHLHRAVDDASAGTAPIADLRSALSAWAQSHPDDLRIMAYGLLRLPDRDGRWSLADPVHRMVALVASTGMTSSAATDVVVDLLGVVTYREMARPLVDNEVAASEFDTNQPTHVRQELP
ncbi:MAG: helix-turn-helix domain-containing protein [Actinomycetota bacterium]